jgi:uncharacterized membrane protein (UPF0127 family)
MSLRKNGLCGAILAVAVMHGALAQETIPEITGPQPKLPTQTMTLIETGGQRHTLTVEIAKTPQQQEIGLMFRTKLADGDGMIFDWGSAHPQAMWMKNTVIPLDMLFIDDKGRISHIAEHAVPYSLAPIDSNGPIRAVIEITDGLAERWNINTGDQVSGAGF